MKYVICSTLFSFLILTSCQHKLTEVKEYNNGVLYKKYTVNQDTLLHGELTIYYEDGNTIFEKSNYIEGQLSGLRILYYDNGQPEIKENYLEDLLQDTLYIYYPSGELKQKEPYIKGVITGVLTAYYENGMLKEKVHYKNNVENGSFVEYFPNGNLQWQGTYLNGDNEFGELLKYDSTGTLIRKLMCDSIAICHTVWTLEKGDVL